jgi:protoporphyrinogen oxidase
MKIENLSNNQVIVQLNENNSFFSSYGTIIAKKENGAITLDEKYWNHNNTTTKYLSQYLIGVNKKDIEENISSGIYKLDNLNK